MNFDVTKPCNNCPFLKTGGIRLTPARAKEIGSLMLSWDGPTFTCHKTKDKCEDEKQHCAGALIFMEKHGRQTQMVRIAHRLGLYDPRKFMSNKSVVASVFNNLKQMIAAQGNSRTPKEQTNAKEESSKIDNQSDQKFARQTARRKR